MLTKTLICRSFAAAEQLQCLFLQAVSPEVSGSFWKGPRPTPAKHLPCCLWLRPLFSCSPVGHPHAQSSPSSPGHRGVCLMSQRDVLHHPQWTADLLGLISLQCSFHHPVAIPSSSLPSLTQPTFTSTDQLCDLPSTK